MNSPLLSKQYGIPTSMYGTAFRVFQKKYVYPRNFIMTALFAGVGIYYICQAVNDMENMLYWLMTAVCLALIASLWYNPYKLRKNLIKSVENISDDIYRIEISDDSMTIEMIMPEQEPETDADEDTPVDTEFFSEPEKAPEKTVINFDSRTAVIEKQDFFLVYILKSVFYVIPKSAFDSSEISFMREHFEKKLGKNFIKQK